MRRTRSPGRMSGSSFRSLVTISLTAFVVVMLWKIGTMATAAVGQVVFGMAIMLVIDIVAWAIWANIHTARGGTKVTGLSRTRTQPAPPAKRRFPEVEPDYSWQRPGEITDAEIVEEPHWQAPR